MKGGLFPVLILCALLCSCSSLSLPCKAPPPGACEGPAESAVFTTVEVGKAISPQDLRPGTDIYRIGKGDRLQIEVVGIPETLATTVVMPDGYLHYDVAPGIRAAGKTIPELEQDLERALGTEYRDASVLILPVSVQSWAYSVMGQVVNPGVYDLARPTTVLAALSRAGGFHSSELGARTQNLADLGRSVLLRGGKLIAIDFTALVEGGAMDQNIYMRPGDYLFIAAKGSEQVYVLGNVMRAGAVPYSSDLTIVHALAAAGGFAPDSFRHGVLLVRNAGSASAQVARVDMMEILRGRAQDFCLQPYDTVWVPRGAWSKFGEYAQEAVVSAISTIAVQTAKGDE